MATPSDDLKPHILFEPVNSAELLEGWLIHCHKGRDRHDIAARRCDRDRVWLGGAATVLSTIVGTSIFAAFSKETANILAAIVVATIGMLAAILTSVSTFLNLAERAEKHRSAGVKYKKVIRDIELILGTYKASDKKLTDVKPSLAGIKQLLDDLEDASPVVPENLYDQVEDNWKKNGIKIVQRAHELYPDSTTEPVVQTTDTSFDRTTDQ